MKKTVRKVRRLVSTTASRIMVTSVLMAAPLVVQFVATDMVGSLTGVRTESEAIQQRRDFKRALDRCEARRIAGEDIACPNPNDAASIRSFLGEEPVAATAPETVVDSVEQTLRTLPLDQLYLLRQYRRGGNCPESLQNSLLGFYELCQSVLRAFEGQGIKGEVDQKAQEAGNRIRRLYNAD